MTHTQWNTLKNNGYYIKVSSGVIAATNKRHIEYAVEKRETDTVKSVIAYINKIAAKELVKLGFAIKRNTNPIRWLNMPESVFNDNSAPLKITWTK